MKINNVQRKFDEIREHWSPRILAELNGQHVKIAKLLGTFDWHSHAEEDEMFLVWKGSLRMELRERVVELGAGDVFVVPKGVEHRPVADEEVEVLLFEPASTVNTGDERNERTVIDPEWA